MTPPDPLRPPFRTTTTSYNPADFSAQNVSATQIVYERGRFPVVTTNALQESEFMAFDPVSGRLRQRTASNGLHTCFEYDSFGRLRRERKRCGTDHPLDTTTDYFEALPGTVPRAKVVSVTRRTAGGDSWTYSGSTGQSVSTMSRNFNGGYTQVLVEHDPAGRIKRESVPFIGPEASFWKTTDYDGLGRALQVREELGVIDEDATPKVRTTTFYYQGSTVRQERRVGADPGSPEHSRNEERHRQGRVGEGREKRNDLLRL